MAMSPEAQAEYERFLREAVLKRGALVSTGSTYYGWIADDWRHTSKCELTTTKVPEEITYSEFAGTFATSDSTHHAVEVSGVSCKCGQLKDRKVRWDASVSEVAEAVFELAFGKKAEGKPAPKKRTGGNFDDDVETTPHGVPWNYN